jgi:hypothetical protein
LQAPLVEIIALRALANERLAPNPDGQGDGYAYSDFRFGDAARFRALAFGYPATSVLLVARYPAGGSVGESFAPAV